jgi:hypothetical protein
MKMYLLTLFIGILFSHVIKGDIMKYQQAELRARVSRAKSIQEVLIILKNSGPGKSMAPPSFLSVDSIKSEEKQIIAAAEQLNRNAHSTIEPRNGGCEPRVICEEVPIDRVSTNNVMSFPQRVEVHRCGGCCQEAQFPCVPIRQESVTFSPLLLISLDDSGNYEVNRPLTLMNHTKCECKCGKKEEQCRSEGKILDSTLCQCIQPRCSPECLISATCSIVSSSKIPRCTCRRRIPGQTSNFCSNPDQRPNSMCSRCETFYG